VNSPTPAPTINDLFCCGQALLPDGRLLAAGGTERFAGFRGLAEAWIFDPTANGWLDAARMTDEPTRSVGGGRWYPTLLTLGSGDVLALAGIPNVDDTRAFNDTVEVFRAAPMPGGSWDALDTFCLTDWCFWPARVPVAVGRGYQE
jgi:hypothetical protein